MVDWRDELETADHIIAQLRNPIPPRIGSRRKKPSPGLDLGGKRECLAHFLAELHEGYLLACDDHDMRSNPNKPHRKLEDNWTETDDAAKDDYGADTGLGQNLELGRVLGRCLWSRHRPLAATCVDPMARPEPPSLTALTGSTFSFRMWPAGCRWL